MHTYVLTYASLVMFGDDSSLLAVGVRAAVVSSSIMTHTASVFHNSRATSEMINTDVASLHHKRDDLSSTRAAPE